MGRLIHPSEVHRTGVLRRPLLSVPLPDEGAAEMVGELHRANPSIPVLVLSRAEDPEIREEFVVGGGERGALQGVHLRADSHGRKEAGERSVEALFTQVCGTGVIGSSVAGPRIGGRWNALAARHTQTG